MGDRVLLGPRVVDELELMAGKVVGEVFDHSGAKGAELLTLLAMADAARAEDAICWPGIDWLARATRLSESQARRYVRKLEKRGEVLIAKGTRKGGRGLTPVYLINLGAFEIRKPLQITAPGGRKVTFEPPKGGTDDTLSGHEKGGMDAGVSESERVSSEAENPGIAMTPDPLEPSSDVSHQDTESESQPPEKGSPQKSGRARPVKVNLKPFRQLYRRFIGASAFPYARWGNALKKFYAENPEISEERVTQVLEHRLQRLRREGRLEWFSIEDFLTRFGLWARAGPNAQGLGPPELINGEWRRYYPDGVRYEVVDGPDSEDP